MSSIDNLQSIANEISAGYESLLEQLEAQRRLELDLREQLARAVDRFNSNDSDNPSDGALSAWQDEIVKQISGASSTPQPNYSSPLNQEILKVRDAIKKLKTNMTPTPPPRKCPVSHKSAMAEDDMTNSMPRKCPVATKSQRTTFEELEKDFTTQGKPSSLECPFATMNRNGIPGVTGERDPIAAEFHPDTLSAQSLDEARACNRCPIRFLDKHSPEEIAEYFEKHKHELPRSHEICVKRYQQNETSIRQLDAKYGNIVNMIQGLGNKHKQYLPSEDQAAMSGTDQKSNAAVEKWAVNVDQNVNVGDSNAEQDHRLSHFEKPLRDVRVGESPTRPWGIHVPLDQPKAVSAASSEKASAVLSIGLESQKPKPETSPKVTTPEVAKSLRTPSNVSSKNSRSRRPNQIIFNGPVFLGYSPEQAALFLQQLGNEKP